MELFDIRNESNLLGGHPGAGVWLRREHLSQFIEDPSPLPSWALAEYAGVCPGSPPPFISHRFRPWGCTPYSVYLCSKGHG